MVKEENASIPWFELPFYRSMTEQILFLGAPRSAIMVNALVAFLFIIPISLLFHFGCIYVARSDDQFFDCLKVYQTKKNYYCT